MTETQETTPVDDAQTRAVAVQQALRTLLRHLAREIAKKLRAQRPDGPQVSEGTPL